MVIELLIELLRHLALLYIMDNTANMGFGPYTYSKTQPIKYHVTT